MQTCLPVPRRVRDLTGHQFGFLRVIGFVDTVFKGITGEFWSQIKRMAQKREITFSLTMEEAWLQFERQQHRCAFTGILLTTRGHRGRGTASIDRIDNAKGYSADNIQWVHKHINQMRGGHTVDHFIELCRQVVEHTK